MSDVLDLVDSSDVEDDCILESVTYVNQKEIDKNNFNYLYKENPLLVEFIEKCYDIENSKGMSRIINKTLIRFYNKTNKTFRKSPDLEKILKRSINMLETNPVMICNHIKELCDILNSFSVRKRIKPITLSTNLEDKIEDVTEEIQPVNNNIEKTNTIIDSEKENQSINEFAGEEDNILLVPQKVVEIGDIRDPLDIEKIKKIETEIARCTTVISKLDEQEVDDDSVNSPYIKSEKLKSKIVILYEQLCNLTGNQPVKKRTINLRVIEGHPEGPVRCLETFLNNNIGPDGVPPFPVFSDVVECVGEANSRDNLGWTKHQILQEARALFTQCGRALQRRRQNREWQDLLHKVKLTSCDEDPADSDPALLKRLEENKRAAVKKESEILERYSMMQAVPQNNVSRQLQSETSEKSEDRIQGESMSEEISMSYSDISHNLSQDNESHTKESTTEENRIIAVPNTINDIKIKKEPEEEIEERLEELCDNFTKTIVEIEDSFLIIEISDSSDDEGS